MSLNPKPPHSIRAFHLSLCIGGSMHGMHKEYCPPYSIFLVPVTTATAQFDPPDLGNLATIDFAHEKYRRAALYTGGPGERAVITWWHLEGFPEDEAVLALVARAFDARSQGDA